MIRIFPSTPLLLRGAFCCALVGALFAPHAAHAQDIVGCEVSYIIYNDEPELDRLWIHSTNDGAFYNPAQLQGYSGRRSVAREANCSPFDEPCAGDIEPLGRAIYAFSNGEGNLLTQVDTSPAGSLDPILVVGVSRPATQPGLFVVEATTAIDAFGRAVRPHPLVCVEEVVCPGTNLGRVNDVPGACGDPTRDRRVTVSDALAALFDATELPELGCEGKLFECDTDSDGRISVLDAARILNVASQIETVLDCPLPRSCRD